MVCNNHERILNILKYVQKHPPKNEVNYFTFDVGLVFLLAGKRLTHLPKEYSIYYAYDEFWLQIDPEEKKIMFYAYMIDDCQVSNRIQQSKGFMDWGKVEANILSFLVTYLRELTGGAYPYSDCGLSTNDMVSAGSAPNSGQLASVPDNKPKHNGYNTSLYSGDAYKERSAFYEKLYDMSKEGRSSIAIDFANEYFGRMRDEKRYEELEIVFRVMDVDKLTIPLLFEILNTSKSLVESVKERQDFFRKVKTRVEKAKPISVEYMLRKIESSGAN